MTTNEWTNKKKHEYVFISVAILFGRVCAFSDNVTIEYVNKWVLKKSKVTFFFLIFLLNLFKSVLSLSASLFLSCCQVWRNMLKLVEFCSFYSISCSACSNIEKARSNKESFKRTLFIRIFKLLMLNIWFFYWKLRQITYNHLKLIYLRTIIFFNCNNKLFFWSYISIESSFRRSELQNGKSYK